MMHRKRKRGAPVPGREAGRQLRHRGRGWAVHTESRGLKAQKWELGQFIQPEQREEGDGW